MSRVLRPAVALPGFPEATTLNLEPVEGAMGLYSVTSAQAPHLRWFVLDASVRLPDYAPAIHRGPVGIARNPDADSRSLLVVVNTSDSQVSANLLAPLLLHTQTA